MSFRPKQATSGSTRLKQLGDDREHALEVARAGPRPPTASRSAPGTTRISDPGGYITAVGRDEQRVHAARRGQRAVARQIARIARQILGGPELQRIDEDAHDDARRRGGAPRPPAGGGPRGDSPSWGRARSAGRPRARRAPTGGGRQWSRARSWTRRREGITRSCAPVRGRSPPAPRRRRPGRRRAPPRPARRSA